MARLFLKTPPDRETPFRRQLKRAEEADAAFRLQREQSKPADDRDALRAPKKDVKDRLHAAAGKVKTAAVSAAAAAAVTAALVSPQLDPPDESNRAASEPAPIVFTVTSDGRTVPDDDADEDRKRTVQRAASQTLQRALPTLKAAAGFAATAVLQFLSFFCTSFFTALTGGIGAGLIGFLGDVLVGFVILFVVLSWLYKKLFPNKKLRELWTLKNLAVLLAFSAAIALMNKLTFLLPEKQRALALLILTAVNLVAVGGLMLMLFSKRGGRKTLLSRLAKSRPVRRAALVYIGWAALLTLFRFVAFRSGTVAAYGAALLLFGLVAGLAYTAERLFSQKLSPPATP